MRTFKTPEKAIEAGKFLSNDELRLVQWLIRKIAWLPSDRYSAIISLRKKIEKHFGETKP